jgi:aspartyl-tRNA(Asn)/glutamyl-tRNA(Gln) amidotransferase subunit A
MTDDIALMSASQLVPLYREGKLSPVEAVKASLARIEKHNAALVAFNLVDAEQALAEARKSEERWRLGAPRGRIDGVPTAIKDILLTKDWPTLRGSHTIDPNQAWHEDAPSVARLREHGAIFIGKTTTPEYGWKGVTDSPLTGITRNPWNPAKTPGGSSGGSAVAVACGMSALSLGTDGGGSIRIPAGFTGIYGLKPTFGRVPAYPASPFGTVAHVGPMTRTVTDAAMMMSVIAEPDVRDWYALPPADGGKAADYVAALERGVKGKRIAFSPTLGGHRVDPEIAKLVADAAEVFAELGAQVEEANPQLPPCGAVFQAHWFTGAANLVNSLSPEQQAMLDPGLREVAAAGAKYSLFDYFAAVKQREAIGLAMNRFHENYDLLLTPALPLPAFDAGLEWPAGEGDERWTDWTPFSYPFNLTRQPAASVPCGFTSGGLPAGLQIVGPLFQDGRVLRASRAYEAARPFKMPTM